MVEKVRTREFEKHYWAVVKNAPPQPEGILENWLVKNEERNKSYVFGKARPNAKLARLEYKEIAVSSGGYHLLDINLHTGRHHQIRCQLANIGCPIKGDLKYVPNEATPMGASPCMPTPSPSSILSVMSLLRSQPPTKPYNVCSAYEKSIPILCGIATKLPYTMCPTGTRGWYGVSTAEVYNATP